MALFATDITPRKANTEMGDTLPTTNLTVKQVCELAGQNEFSFYGPWHLSTVFATKVCEVDYKTSNYSLGDFRLYNHSQVSTGIPKGGTGFNRKYDPGDTTVDVTLTSFIYNMNVLDALQGAYSSSALYMCYDFYTSSAARITGTSPTYRDYSNPVTWDTISQLTGHIRTQVEKAESSQQNTPPAVPITAGYVDIYIYTSSGVRVLTLGESKAGGYLDLTFSENPKPYYYGSFTTLSSPPVTGARIAVWGSSTPACSEAPADGVLEFNSGTYSHTIYCKLKGASGGSQQYLVAATGVTVTFTHLRGSTTIETLTFSSQTFSNTSAKSFTVVWDNTKPLVYGDTVKTEITAITWGVIGSTCTS